VEGKSGNFQGGLDYLNQALTITITLGNDEERAMVLQALGVSYQWLNKPNEALNYYQQSLDIKRRLGQKRGVAESLHAMAPVEDSLGRSQDALKHYQESLQLLREIGDIKGAGDTLYDFSVFYLTRGQYDQGLDLAKQALKIERDAGDLKYVAMCLNAVGGAYFSKGDYDNALIYYQQALQAHEKLKVPSDTADTLHNLAELYTTTGQYDEAARQYLRSLDLRRGADDKKGAAMDSNSLGVLFSYQGRYGAALNAKQEALKTFQGLQERSTSLGEIIIGYGEAQTEAGLGLEGQKNLEDGLSLARELKSQSLVAQALNNVGNSSFYRGDLKSAEARYREALQAAGGSKDPRLVLLSKINLAKVAVWQGRSRESLGALKGLVDQADKTGEKYFSVQASLELAHAFVDLKDYPHARQELDRALARSEKMGLRGLQAEAHYFLGTLLRLSGKAADASAEYQAALKLLEQIRSEPGAEKTLDRYDLKTIYTESNRWAKTVV
jgi:tetratricopeptide (TPR) repeat protein